MRDALLRAAAADLELRLAGAAPADAAGEARERVVLLRRGAAALYLSCASSTWSLPSRLSARCAKMSRMSCVRSMTLRSVCLAMADACAGVRSRSKMSDLGVELHRADDDVVELALARSRTSDRCARAAGRPRRRPRRPAVRASSRSSRMLSSASMRRAPRFDLSPTWTRIARPSFAFDRRARARVRANSASRSAMSSPTSTSSLADRHRARPRGTAARRSSARDVVRVDACDARLAVGRELDGRDEVEAQAHEVDEIVARERLAAQVRVHEAQPAEAPFGRAQAPDVRQHQLPGVADDHVVDLARAVHERADLPPRLDGGLDERARQLGRRDVVGRNAAPVDALERPERRRREAGLVAVDFDARPLARTGSSRVPRPCR